MNHNSKIPRATKKEHTLLSIQLTDQELAQDVDEYIRIQSFLYRFRQEFCWCLQIHTGIPQGDMDPATYFRSLQALFPVEELQALANAVLETMHIIQL